MRPNSTTTPSGASKTNGEKHFPAQHVFKENSKTLGVPLGADLVGPRAGPNLLIFFVCVCVCVSKARNFVPRCFIQQFINNIRLVKNEPPMGQHKNHRWVNIKATGVST